MNKETKLQNEKMGFSIEKYLEACIRSGEFSKKEFKKKIIRNNFITKEELKKFEKYEEDFLNMDLKDFSEFNKKDNSKLEEELDLIKKDFLDSDNFKSELDMEAALLMNIKDNPYEKFCEIGNEIYTKAEEASDLILEFGDRFENPLIFKAYENINLIAEQQFIVLNYCYSKLVKAYTTKNIMELYDHSSSRHDKFKDIISSFKNISARLIVQEDYISILNLHFVYNTKEKVVKGFRLKMLSILETSIKEMKELKQDSTDIMYYKYHFTLRNVFESFYNQFRYIINCLNNNEIERRAAEFNIYGNEGKNLLLKLIEFTNGLDYDKSLLLKQELKITKEELQELLTKHNLKI